MTKEYETPVAGTSVAADWEHNLFGFWEPIEVELVGMVPSLGKFANWRRPVLTATPELAGYDEELVDFPPIEAGYGFVRVGANYQIGDEYWTRSFADVDFQWIQIQSLTQLDTIPADAFPVRRKLQPVQQRWAQCRHKRELAATKCVVCAAFGRLTTS